MYRVDLNWNDLDTLPDKMRPDVEYLFGRMNEAVMQMVDARPGDRIVDVGCGRGIEVLKMSQAGAFVIGIEPSGFMLERARETASFFGHNTLLIRAIGESLPVKLHSVDKVLCKGALDHFADPAQAVYQMALAVKPGGHVIIALANFESLGFKIGKFIFMLRKMIGIRNPYPRLPWELPHDHTVKFDYNSIIRATRSYLDIEKVTGISLLCCAPGWGDILGKLPANVSGFILIALDRIAGVWAGMSDVVIVKGRLKDGLSSSLIEAGKWTSLISQAVIFSGLLRPYP